MPPHTRVVKLVLALGLAAASIGACVPVLAEDPLRSPFSELATRELRKQLKDKQIPFNHPALSGRLAAIEPETRLTVEVRQFKLAGDVVSATLHGTGRFKIDGRANLQAQDQADSAGEMPREFGVLADVELTIVIEARFLKEGNSYFVEPKVHDLDAKLTFLEFTPANLSGSEVLLSTLARAAFARYKDQIIAQANAQLGRQPF